ncbi:MAG: type II toxin-antitoxin system HicB family antitoxin [Bacillota bacterium]|nr:type II toxin-antitoxin system HicB family antitoxin [Bacillota bacterium]
MNKKLKFNLGKVDSKKFNSIKDVEEFITVSDNYKEIELKNKHYEQLEYPIKLQKTSDEHSTYWVAEHPDLPGCMTHGYTKEEALANLDDAKKGWIYSALSHEMLIPEPGTKSEIEDCSGRILLRVPKELHYRLLQKAKEDGTSLNQELLFLVSTALGTKPSLRNKKL